jgi:4-amino-4-deoxy-L-arabinose transferase-like glycosyltransferase
MSIATRRSESRIIGVLLVFGLALRGVIAWRFRVDSDEPQHLHVVWAWTQGLLPYRDVFDNHMPLFHLLTAPALLAIGERPTALLWMRLLMLPQWGAALLVTALIGRRLFTSRVGAWSAVLAGFYPLFFFCSLEYRPDVLWTVLWLWAVLIAIDGPPTTERGFLLGLVLGTAAAVSLKTILMLLAFGIAAGLTLWLVPAERRPWRRVFSSGVARRPVSSCLPAWWQRCSCRAARSGHSSTAPCGTTSRLASTPLTSCPFA